jgi:hypothetical protein
MTGQDADVGGAEGPGGFDELALTDGHHLGADQAGVADPSGDREGEDEVEEAGAEECDEGDGDEDSGQREEGVRDVDVEDDVRDTAVEAGEQSGDEACGEGEADDGDGDHERDSCAVKGAGEDVAAEFVGTEEMGGGGGCHAVVQVECGGVVGREERREDGCRDEAEQQYDTGQGERLTTRKVG